MLRRELRPERRRELRRELMLRFVLHGLSVNLGSFYVRLHENAAYIEKCLNAAGIDDFERNMKFGHVVGRRNCRKPTSYSFGKAQKKSQPEKCFRTCYTNFLSNPIRPETAPKPHRNRTENAPKTHLNHT